MNKLLIVDDNFYDREGLMGLSEWTHLNFSEIHSAKDGEEGLAKALEIEPLLILADISMPGIDGLTMAKKILEKKPDTKFIFISCFDDSRIIRESLQLNVFGYILKPIDVEELMRAVKKVLSVSSLENTRNKELHKLQSQLAEQLPFVQEQIVRDVIRCGLSQSDYNRLSQFDMELKRYYAFAIVRVCEKHERTGVMDRALVNFNATKIRLHLKKNQSDGIRMYSILLNNGDVVVLLYLDNCANVIEAEEFCFEYLNELKDIFESDLVNISICFSGISDNYEDMHAVYARTEYALDMNIYRRSNIVIMADKMKDTNAFLECDVDELKIELKNLFETRDLTKCTTIVDKYYGHLNAVNENVIKEFTLTFISVIQVLLFEMNLNMKEIFNNGGLIWEKLLNFNSIFDIRQWIYNILKSIVEYCSLSVGDRDAVLVRRIKSIIAEQYREIENVNQISEQVHVSAVHANKIFKKNVGCTIFDYLTKVKMDKAKELLVQSDFKIYEIAEYLGYKSKTYFASLFKEYAGKTPKEYRMLKEQ